MMMQKIIAAILAFVIVGIMMTDSNDVPEPEGMTTGEKLEQVMGTMEARIRLHDSRYQYRNATGQLCYMNTLGKRSFWDLCEHG